MAPWTAHPCCAMHRMLDVSHECCAHVCMPRFGGENDGGERGWGWWGGTHPYWEARKVGNVQHNSGGVVDEEAPAEEIEPDGLLILFKTTVLEWNGRAEAHKHVYNEPHVQKDVGYQLPNILCGSTSVQQHINESLI